MSLKSETDATASMSLDSEADEADETVWRRVEDYCFLAALRRAVSAFPRSDCALKCLTSSCCPQPYRCIGNGAFVVSSFLLSGLMMGPYRVVDTLFVKPKLYRLYQRYLREGVKVKGRILVRKPSQQNDRIDITLVEYDAEHKTYVKYMAHSCSDEEEIDLLVLPKRPKSACSRWTAEAYVDQHSTCQCITMILWSVWMTLGVAFMIALFLQWEIHEDCAVTLAVLIPSALLIVCLFLYLRNDPVQQFLLESGKEIEKDEEWGRNHIYEDRASKTAADPHCVGRGCSCVGAPRQQDMEDRGDEEH